MIDLSMHRVARGAAVVLMSVALLWGARAAPANAQQTSDARAPHVVFVTGDHEYGSERTIPLFADQLEFNYGMRTTVLQASPDEYAEENIPGLEALADADLAVFFLRFRRLPEDQLAHIKAYLDSGKPVIGFRTTTHAFRYPPGDPRESWNNFGAEVLGAPWIEHYGHESSTDAVVAETAREHPILAGVDPAFHVRSWVYIVRPDYPPPTADVLLNGTSVGPSNWAEREVQPVAWTWTGPSGRRVFATTMGHPEDFAVESFQRLIFNAVYWAVDRAPAAWAGDMPIDVPFEMPFKLRRAERVVMLGAGYVERDANSGYLETLLSSRFYDSGATFRSLGWPGDTVNVHMRPRNFGSIQDHVTSLSPSLVFVAYGMNESFDGQPGLEPFREGYQTLLTMLQDEVGARTVLISPTPHQSNDSPIADAASLNDSLRRYTQVVGEIAEQNERPFVDLFESVGESDSELLAYSQNGSHLTPLGYWLAGIRTE